MMRWISSQNTFDRIPFMVWYSFDPVALNANILMQSRIYIRVLCVYVCVCVCSQKHPWCKTRTKHNFWSIKHLQFSYIKEWTHKNRETKEHFRAFCIKILWPSITFTIHVQIINNFSLKHYAFIKSHKMKTKLL